MTDIEKNEEVNENVDEETTELTTVDEDIEEQHEENESSSGIASTLVKLGLVAGGSYLAYKVAPKVKQAIKAGREKHEAKKRARILKYAVDNNMASDINEATAKALAERESETETEEKTEEKKEVTKK